MVRSSPDLTFTATLSWIVAEDDSLEQGGIIFRVRLQSETLDLRVGVRDHKNLISASRLEVNCLGHNSLYSLMCTIKKQIRMKKANTNKKNNYAHMLFSRVFANSHYCDRV